MTIFSYKYIIVRQEKCYSTEKVEYILWLRTITEATDRNWHNICAENDHSVKDSSYRAQIAVRRPLKSYCAGYK